MTLPYMEARTYGLGQLISERRMFAVPDHQRDYAWTPDVVSAFLDDVIGAMQDNAPDYFAGLVVLVGPQPGGAWEILDGQQRLATATMIYAALRDALGRVGLEKDAQHIQAQFIGVTELGDEAARPRLNLNVNNRPAFVELVVSTSEPNTLEARRREGARSSSNRRVVEGMLTCYDRVSRLVRESGDAKDQAQDLYRLANYLRDNVRVVCVDVPSTANAYVIFESLNDRGLDLSALDLVKNHIFGAAGDRLPDVQANWSKMVAYLGDRRAEDFLRVFWTSQYGPLPRGRLLDQWRIQSESQDEVAHLVRDMAEAAEQYAALDMPEHELWSDYSEACRESIRSLSLLGSRPMQPIILAAFEGMSASAMEEILRFLVTLAVRVMVVGGRSSALETACARAAQGIFSGDLATPRAVWQELAAVAPDDDEFREGFSQYAESKEAKARYLLYAMEGVAAGDAAHPLPPQETLWIDHILPRHPTKAWQPILNADPDLRLQYVHRLGNLCLLERKPDRTRGGGGFEQKKAALYAPSELVLTRQLAEKYTTWDRQAIETRQRDLAELALLAWPRP
ncbi:MAG: DUF262 domain-containing HNH endonuclease family protein [Anaerolineae bacterium]